jgi:triacylglycerol lipase
MLRQILATILISMSALANGSNEGTPNVVLVHGFMDTGSVFKKIQQRLESRGFNCIVPNLQPRDARNGIDELSATLQREIESKIPHHQSFSLIGFSMGGLVARHYLQERDGAKQCERLITISSPHHGTLTAWLYPGMGARQMRPGSEFFSNLAATESRLGNIQLFSYRTPLDLMILPSRSSTWQRATNLDFAVLLHPLMLHSKPVLADIEARLNGE